MCGPARSEIVLPAAARMRRRQEFDLAVRRGRRANGRLLTAYLLTVDDASAGDAGVSSPKVGFVVTRAVGGAVVRNRVRRRLRDVAQMRTRWLPAGSLLVIRANPRAADARQRDLAAELDLVLGRLLRRQVRA
ncbi:MAG TPA: ribonuclease P protein component [Streptosporangiaceae bacterium]|nr:ribonuclease P protein component [Streptosporangiaceae bacterium]